MSRPDFLYQASDRDHCRMTLPPEPGCCPFHPRLYLPKAMPHLYLLTCALRRTCSRSALLDFSRTLRHGHITYGPAWAVIWTRAHNKHCVYGGLAMAPCGLFLPRRRLDRGRTLLARAVTAREGLVGGSCLGGDCTGSKDAVHSTVPMQHSSWGWQLPRWSSADTRVSSRWLRTCRGNKRKLRNVHRSRIRSPQDGRT